MIFNNFSVITFRLVGNPSTSGKDAEKSQKFGFLTLFRTFSTMVHLNQTINANMASFVQEQLLNISIVYQLLEYTKFEGHTTNSKMVYCYRHLQKIANLANPEAHGDNPTSTPSIASFWSSITS